jgi:CheY-like chemotaxis protein
MNLQNPLILLVENNEASLELYQRELSKVFNVLAFADEKGVLETITTHQVQVVIIEPEMRSGKGWELIDQIQILASEFRPKIIICGLQDARRKSAEIGAATCLVKPVLPKDLSKVVLEVLNFKKTARKFMS